MLEVNGYTEFCDKRSGNIGVFLQETDHAYQIKCSGTTRYVPKQTVAWPRSAEDEYPILKEMTGMWPIGFLCDMGEIAVYRVLDKMERDGKVTDAVMARAEKLLGSINDWREHA